MPTLLPLQLPSDLPAGDLRLNRHRPCIAVRKLANYLRVLDKNAKPICLQRCAHRNLPLCHVDDFCAYTTQICPLLRAFIYRYKKMRLTTHFYVFHYFCVDISLFRQSTRVFISLGIGLRSSICLPDCGSVNRSTAQCSACRAIQSVDPP